MPGIIHDPSTYSCVCSAGKYRDGDACYACNSLCSECTGPSNKDCKAYKCSVASKAYALEGTPSTCLYMCRTSEDNLFIETSNRTCRRNCQVLYHAVECISPCRSCFNKTTYACSSCISGYILLGTVCQDDCPPKYYEDSGVCLPCDAKCKSCAGKTNYCVNGCETPYLFKNHRCLSDCGEGFTGIDGVCEECSAECLACYYNSSSRARICNKCVSGKLLHLGECVQLCPIGFYPDSSECKACALECAKCVAGGNKACTLCNTALGYTMIAANVCDYPTCTRGTYFNTTLRECKDCRPECSECEAYNNCTACSKGFMLDPIKNSCYDECAKVGYKRAPVTNECLGTNSSPSNSGRVEICGDGRNMGDYECDDGNTKNGDGCNSVCKVEANYACSGGNVTTADSCVNRKPPEMYALRYYGNRTAVLTFTVPIRFLTGK